MAFVRATSSSATQANPKCRVVIPFSRTVTEAEYRNVMSWLLDETGLRPFADPVSTRPVQLMYRVTDTGANLVESTIRDGEFLDVEGVLLLAPDVASSQARDEAGGNALTERMDGQTDERPCACVADRVARYLGDVEDGHPAFFDLAGDVWEALHRGHTIGNALAEDGAAVAAYRAHCAAKTRQDDTDRVIAATAARTAGRQDGDMVKRHGADDCPDDVLGMFNDEDDFGDTEVPTAYTRSSWTPVDLGELLDEGYSPRLPELMVRDDGTALLYPGLTHSIQGESGSGKSLVVQAVAAKLVKDGGRVLYLDFESSASEVVAGRFVKTFGCSRDQVLAGLAYVRPDEAPRGPGFEALLAEPRDLVVIDGVTEALNVSGLQGESKTNSNDAITQWHRLLPKRLAERTGAAVVQIDHVTKSKDARDFAIGGQAKRATITGAAYTLEVAKPFSRGLDGEVRLYLTKDREGHVMASPEPTQGKGRLAAVATIESREDGMAVVSLRAPQTAPTPEARDEAMRYRVAKALGELPDDHPGWSLNTLRREVSGNNDQKGAALAWLVDAGYVTKTPKGQSNLHRLGRPYLPEFEDDEVDE